jgi:hypothetical protein
MQHVSKRLQQIIIPMKILYYFEEIREGNHITSMIYYRARTVSKLDFHCTDYSIKTIVSIRHILNQ